MVVEPDRDIAAGLSRSLRVFETAWHVTLVSEPPPVEALGEVDAVVADAPVAGGGFFAALKVQRPTVVRAALVRTGLPSDQALRLAGLAHHVIHKPVLPAHLFELVERSIWVLRRLRSDRLRQAVAQVGVLPALPQTYAALTRATSNPDVDMGEVAAVVQADVGVTMALLRIINSAFFGFPRRVGTVQESVRYLGIRTLESLVLTVELFDGMGDRSHLSRVLQAEAVSRGFAMREVFGRTPLGERAFTAGVLADVGRLLLSRQLPLVAQAIERDVAAHKGTLCEVEQARLDCTHPELGAALLESWNLPADVVEAVALHHQPTDAGNVPGLVAALALVTLLEESARATPERAKELEREALRLSQSFPLVNVKGLKRSLSSRADAG